MKHYNSIASLQVVGENETSKIKLNCDNSKTPCYTLAIIMQDIFPYKNQIVHKIVKNGLTVIAEKFLKLESEQAYEFLSLDGYKNEYAELLFYMSSQSITVYCLAGFNAPHRWKQIIKEVYQELRDCELNSKVLMGSDNCIMAKKEIKFFFPRVILEPIEVSIAENEQYLMKNVIGILKNGLKEVCAKKPKYPLLFLANWLSENHQK